MTNEQKEQRLEQMAKWADKNALQWKDHAVNCGSHPRESEGCMAISEAESAAAALLRECAGMMRERATVQWDTEGGAAKNGLYLWAGPVRNGFASLVLKGKRRLHLDWHPTLESARLAAVAWVDEQEGKP